jgi:hypothetical protein
MKIFKHYFIGQMLPDLTLYFLIEIIIVVRELEEKSTKVLQLQQELEQLKEQLKDVTTASLLQSNDDSDQFEGKHPAN